MPTRRDGADPAGPATLSAAASGLMRAPPGHAQRQSSSTVAASPAGGGQRQSTREAPRPAASWRREWSGKECSSPHIALQRAANRLDITSSARSFCRADPDRFEQLLLDTVLRCANGEVGPQPGRLEDPPQPPVAPLALLDEREQVAGRDDLAFHAGDLDDLHHPPDSVAHALNLDDQIDGAGDLLPDRAQRQ